MDGFFIVTAVALIVALVGTTVRDIRRRPSGQGALETVHIPGALRKAVFIALAGYFVLYGLTYGFGDLV